MDDTTPVPPEQLPCPNCGDDTEGNYCRTCGQRKTQHRASVRVLLRDALEDQLSITTELPRTLRALFFRPGFLTTEYSAGRIARYIPPLRLYLIASVVLFVSLSLRTKQYTPLAAAAPDAAAVAARQDSFAVKLEAIRDSLRHVPDSLLTESKRCTRDGKSQTQFCTQFRAINRFMAPRIVHLDKIPPAELGSRMTEFLIQRTPTVVFILLPIFALLLKLLYWRSKKFYAEHFVFALHVHSFAALILAIIVLPLHEIALLLGRPGHPLKDMEFVALGLVLWIFLYVLAALKRVSGQGWIKTVLKFLTLSGLYAVLCIGALMAEIMAAMIYI
jgi:hypothetical protein